MSDDGIKKISGCNICKFATIEYSKLVCKHEDDEVRKLFRQNKAKAAESCEYFKHKRTTEYTSITLDRAMRFILAGMAEFKITSGKTGNDLYYRIIRKVAAGSTGEDTSNLNRKISENYYLYWLYGGNSLQDLKFLGTIYFNNKSNTFEFSKGKVGSGYGWMTSVKAILFLLNKLYNGKYSTNIGVYHLGYCGHCGKELINLINMQEGLCTTCSNRSDIPKLDMSSLKNRENNN